MVEKKKVPINYTSRDFNTIKESLVEYAKRYYPNNFKDFNEASFGSLMLDTVAYVGDILSFYLDYQANESFLDTALEYNNVIKHSRQLGYKFTGAPTAVGEVSFFVLVPANSAGTAVDADYYPKLKRGSTVFSTAGTSYLLIEDIDFSKTTNEIIVSNVNSTTGVPTYFAVKAKGRVISGELKFVEAEIGEYERFKKVTIDDSNVSEIISVVDSEGNSYFEVDYLSQEIVYSEVDNPSNSDSEFAPKIMKPIAVPRRFIVHREAGETTLQFGHGSESDDTADLIVDPSNVLMDIHGKDYISDKTFDPYNFLTSDKLGVAPSNTTLTVVYRSNNSTSLNAPVNTVTQTGDVNIEFKNPVDLDGSQKKTIVESLEVTNEEPICGDTKYVNSEELKQRAYGAFYSQNRAVTAEDYKVLVYSMPPQFGSVKRCNLIQDSDSFKRNLNLYVISEGAGGFLIESNSYIKQNLKIWLNRNRMINDTIDILDAKIINFAIDFDVIAERGVNKHDLLDRCIRALREEFNILPDIGESFSITKLYKVLNLVPGVVDTKRVEVFQKNGGKYSDIRFNTKSNTSSDGRFISIPKNAIYEIKYPNQDIRGTIR
jgi:hypothetical protein|tara:strand:+ start:185 stop:1984 length:1800 start_codon:yes stop_codon:yes gene_type:complete